MLGWHISVFRQAEGGSVPGTPRTEHSDRIAVWQTGSGGLDWLAELVTQREAIDLGGDGYPSRYTARARHLIPRIVNHPLGADTVWVSGPHDVLDEGWEGRTAINRQACDACRPTEWLLVEAWDVS